MKKDYTKIDIEIIKFDKESVITTSVGDTGTIGGPQAGDNPFGI